FNRLVLSAGLTWREIALLRAIAKYLRQAGSAFSQTYMEETFADNAKLARLLVELFGLRFDPALASSGDAKRSELVLEIDAALDAVTSLDQDRILRSFLSVIQAMLRTSYFRGEDGWPRPYLSFKLDLAAIPDLPAPPSMYQIFVYSPRMVGGYRRVRRGA